MPETPTEVLNGATRIDGTQQRPAPPLSRPPRHGNRNPWIAAALTLTLLVVAAVTVLILTSQGSKKSTAQSALADATVYRAKLSATMTPIVSANRTLSQALQTIGGSTPTLRAATNAAQAAQAQTVAARGALGVLTVPISRQLLSQQATQALTQETGYLQAVTSTLSDPGGSAPSSLQPLASATSSAFVPLGNIAPGGASSLYGIDNLQAWASGANAQGNRNATPKVVVSPGVTTTVVAPASSGGLSACDQNISANPNTSCPLAENVFVAYWNTGNSVDGWSDAGITAQSPETSGFYDLSCVVDGGTVNCSGTGRTGDPLFVTFPMQAIVVY